MRRRVAGCHNCCSIALHPLLPAQQACWKKQKSPFGPGIVCAIHFNPFTEWGSHYWSTSRTDDTRLFCPSCEATVDDDGTDINEPHLPKTSTRSGRQRWSCGQLVGSFYSLRALAPMGLEKPGVVYDQFDLVREPSPELGGQFSRVLLSSIYEINRPALRSQVSSPISTDSIIICFCLLLTDLSLRNLSNMGHVDNEVRVAMQTLRSLFE